MDTQEFTQRIKRRNSVSADPAELARAVNVQDVGGKRKTEMIRELKKSTWAGSGKIRGMTMSISGKGNDFMTKQVYPRDGPRRYDNRYFFTKYNPRIISNRNQMVPKNYHFRNNVPIWHDCINRSILRFDSSLLPG